MGEPRWTRNPAWALFSQTHAQRQLLLVSGGADELYVVDEADTPTIIERILGHWEKDTLAILQDDAECGPAVRQVIRLGVLVPLRAARRVTRYALDWLGEPLPGLADGFDQHAGADLQRVDTVADADLLVLVRHGLGWEQALARYRTQMPTQPHLLLDLSYHHTLALGPYVVPGQSACVYCLGNRVLRRWGEAPVPAMPAVAAQPARIAALVAPLLDQPPLLLGYLERSVWLDLHRLHGERDRVLRLPWCPACQGGEVSLPPPLSLPWDTGRP
ncbi:hypothetical protein [Stenotrophomonas rhizophila]|uniref:Bacteriocin biosynthesis cyclodehydratase domain-containing protein n=1 Tax=Stenotrophomonas rhizophila TaxID=216778 RepID=A0AAW5PNN4_9GAMM|nr:hypothetical protein [Stenotrophomonas rhizophila]MCS4281355.1 hypothetical protein [Stenotrophomonas rhizophila]